MASAADTRNPAASSTSIRFPWLYGGIIAGLVAIALLAVLLARGQKAANYPPYSPQRAVATYLNLLQTGKVDRAYAMTDFGFPQECGATLADFHQQWDNWGANSHRVTVADVHQTGGTASVTVDVTSFSANGFGPSE